MIERTATVALPTAASTSVGLISGELGTTAALDAFSTVYELRLTRSNAHARRKWLTMYDSDPTLHIPCDQ